MESNTSQWADRNWIKWLNSNLTFPIEVERIDSDDSSVFFRNHNDKPFSLGHIMKIIEIDDEDDHYGIITKVEESRHIGHAPILDLKPLDKESQNYKLLLEYNEWFYSDK